ncbi:hypothetical protein, conserved [Eimeria brunetti]|uniref:Leucine rich repeat protein n=1 Tax=Eimeria brunetti TaxID=51314 RepID=U6LRP2_9EIME|nr:hypothetical protein, conserved [Eimeria brunetti]
MDSYDSPLVGRSLKGGGLMQQYAEAFRRTTTRVNVDPRAAATTMPQENSNANNNLQMDGSNQLLQGNWESPTKFDRLRDLSLLTERDEAEMFPPPRQEITYTLPTPPATQETEPELWHPTNPSTMAARGLPAVETFLGGDTLPRQLIARLNASDTRLLAGETEQLTAPFVRVEGTSEKYRFFPASEELPLSGLWHDPPLFSDAGKGQTALRFKPKEPSAAHAKSSLSSLPPDPSGLPMTPPRPISLSEEQVKTAPRAAMQYAPEDISVYPGGITMENAVDLQEKALFKSFERLSQDSIVENLMLDAVRPGFKRGVVQQLQQPTTKQWREQQRAESIKAKKAEKTPAEPNEPPTKTEKAAASSGKKVTFDLPSSSSPQQIGASEGKEAESQLEQLTQRLRQIQREHHANETHRKESASGALPSATSDAPPTGTDEFVGDTLVNELISRCSLKLRTLNGGMKFSSVEPKPQNSTVAPKEMTRPSRLLRDIEAVEVRRNQKKGGNKPGVNGFSPGQQRDDGILYLPQPTEESISLKCSKGIQGLRALRGRPHIRSPQTMPKADLVCLSRTVVPASSDVEEESFISEEEAAENMHEKVIDLIDRPSYEIYHSTPTPPEDLVDATPSLKELARNFVPTTGYPHDANNNNYPAAVPAFVSRLSKSQDSRMSVPPAGAVLYAIPKESGACSIVEAMPTDPRSGASQITEAALANMSAKEIRNVEELVAGGFVALQRQTHKIDYKNPWEDDKLHLKMIVNEPIHARDPLFMQRQKELLDKWKYPANEISPGYYIKEANLEEVRQAILASKQQRSIFDLQKALKEAKEREEAELQRQREAENAEIAKRLREGREREQAAAASVEQQEPHAGERPAEQVPVAEKTDEQLPETHEEPLSVEQLKRAYRKLRKRGNAEDIEEMKRIKRQIAELTGRKKKPDAHMKKGRREALAPPPDADLSAGKTDEMEESEKRRERVREMLKNQQGGGAAGMLAQVIEGRGLEAQSESEEESPGEEDEEESLAEEDQRVDEEETSEISSLDDTVSSGSVSSHESTEHPVFQRSEYSAMEYQAVPESLQEWMKLPVDYCGRMFLETRGAGTMQPRKFGTRALPMARSRASGLSEQIRMFLMLEARGPIILVYCSPQHAPKKRFKLPALCGKGRPQTSDVSPQEWKYLCAFVLDNTGEAQGTDMMGGGSGGPYKAIKINARIVQEAAALPSEADLALFTKEQLALRDKAYFSGILSADTESETAEWLAVFNGRKTFFRYLSSCKDACKAPMLPVAASLLSPGPREIVLQGVPYHKEVDKAIFTSLKVPYLDSLCCGWRGLNADELAGSLQNVSCRVRTLDLTANMFGSTVLTWLGGVCNRLRISQLCLAENDIAGDSTAAQGIANLLADPDPLFLDLRRTALVDDDCLLIARELENVQQPGLVPKTVNFGENDISVEGLKEVAAAVAKTLPRFKVLCLPNIPALDTEALQNVLKEVPQMRQAQLSRDHPNFPFRSLNEMELPERCLALPAVFSGRLFVEVEKPVSNSPGSVTATCLFLAFFEVRGPALVRYSTPPRPNISTTAASKRSPGVPLGQLARSFGDELQGIFLTSVSLSASRLTVTGKKIMSNDLVSRDSSETWVLQADSVDYIREWFRVLRIRQAGLACESLARGANEPLHPGVGQYCTSCFRQSLDLGGRQLAPGQFARLFMAVSVDFRLKSVDMSNMQLDVEALRRFPKSAFSRSELTVVDLSFNSITPEGDMSAVVAFCGSARSCARLVLDGNPLGDTEEAAGFVFKLLECRIQSLCLNACSLGDTFAEALAKYVTNEPKRFPFITALEVQTSAISVNCMKNMLDALMTRCPSLSSLCLYGNGFDNIGPFIRRIKIDYTKTHRDSPTRQVVYCRRQHKKPNSVAPSNPGVAVASDKSAHTPSQPGATAGASPPQANAATTPPQAPLQEPAIQGPG